ncbi:MAG: hypothetical protein HQL32_08265 [Planctomycetes bacterium]|nr:hypothetical protein [Planctomycetota bacterium]
MKLNLDSVAVFNSISRSHYNLHLGVSCGGEDRNIEWHIKCLKRTLEGDFFTLTEASYFFQTLQQIIELLDIDELEQSISVLKGQIITRKGIEQIDGQRFTFCPNAPARFRNEVLNGQGKTSFALRVYRQLERRRLASTQANDIISHIWDTENHIEQIQKGEVNPEIDKRPWLKAEIILTGKWGLLGAMEKVLSSTMEFEIIDAMKKKRQETICTFHHDLESIADQLRSIFLEIMKIKQNKGYPSDISDKAKNSLESYYKICTSKLLLINQLIENKSLSENEEVRRVIVSLKIKLIYTINSLSQVVQSRGSLRVMVFERMLFLQLYFNLLADVHSYDELNLSFSKKSQIKVHFLPDLGGKSLIETISLLSEITKSPKFNDKIAEKFYDHLMNDLFIVEQEAKVDKDDYETLMALQRWILLSFFQRRLMRMVGHFELLRKHLENYFSKDAKPYVPRELYDVFFDVSYVLANLLKSQAELHKVFAKTNYVRYRRLKSDPRLRRLKKYSEILYAEPIRAELNEIKSKLSAILSTFLNICALTNRYTGLGVQNAFEKSVHEQLHDMGFQGSLTEAMFDMDVFQQLMQRPWVKNQSLNREKLLELARVCQILAMTIAK